MHYYRGESALDSNGNIIDFSADNNNSTSFKFKQEKTGQTGNRGTKDVELMNALEYLSNIWRALVMPSINCEINFQLKLSKKCIIAVGTVNNQNPSFQINDTKLCSCSCCNFIESRKHNTP